MQCFCFLSYFLQILLLLKTIIHGSAKLTTFRVVVNSKLLIDRVFSQGEPSTGTSSTECREWQGELQGLLKIASGGSIFPGGVLFLWGVYYCWEGLLLLVGVLYSWGGSCCSEGSTVEREIYCCWLLGGLLVQAAGDLFCCFFCQ